MPSANATNTSQILKDIWADDLEATYYEDSTLHAMVGKDTSWSGNAYDVVINYGPIAGRSCTFEVAQANRAPSKFTRMVITTSENYAIWSIDHKLIQLSRNDEGAVERILKGELDRASLKLGRSMSWMVYGSGGGKVGAIATGGVSGSTVTLADRRNIRNFEPGDRIECYSNDGAMYSSAGTLRAGGPLEVSAVNATLGTVTFTSAVPASWTAGDSLFPEGDYRRAFYGLDAYISNVADASVGTLWTMDRTLFRHRLAGIRVGGKGLSVEDAVKRALTRASDLGARVTHIFMNTDDFLSFEMMNQTKKFGSALTEKAGSVGFTGLSFVKPGKGGEIKVFPDADCPKNIIYGLQLSDVSLRSAGELPMFLTVDGKPFDTEPEANAWRGRMGGYGQLVVHNPGNHFVLDLTLAEAS